MTFASGKVIQVSPAETRHGFAAKRTTLSVNAAVAVSPRGAFYEWPTIRSEQPLADASAFLGTDDADEWIWALSVNL
jgi:hypothetical protein